MRYTRHCILCATVLAAVAHAAHAGPGDGDLTPDQQALLSVMDANFAAECLDLAQKAKAWKARFDALRKQLPAQPADAPPVTGPTQDALSSLIVAIDADLQNRSPKLQQYLTFAATLHKRLQDAARQAQTADFDPNVQVGVDEGTFRDGLKKQAIATLARNLLGTIDTDFFTPLEGLRSPAQFASSFVEQQIKQFFNQPYPFGPVSFQIIDQQLQKSVFSPDVNLALLLQYNAAGLSLKASGLYFRYKPGKPPEPAFDRVKVQPGGLDALLNSGLKSIGDDLPDFGLPIRILNPRFVGFDNPDPLQAGGLGFTVRLGLDGALDFGSADLVQAQADVMLFANGKSNVGAIGGTIGAVVPIGTSGLILDGGTVKLKPKDKLRTVAIGTHIAPAVGGKDGVSFDVEIAFGFPVTKTGIAYHGRLVLGDSQTLGTVDGVISREKVNGHFRTSGNLQSGFKLDCQFEVNREGMTAHGDLEALMGVAKILADLYVGFNGFGAFSVSENFDLGQAVKVQASLGGNYAPGFRKVTLQGALALDIEAEPLGTLGAAVDFIAVTDPRPRIQGTGHVGDVSVAFDGVSDFKGVYAALRAAVLRERDAVYGFLANVEKNAGAYAAEREQALDCWVYANAKKVGLDKLSIDKGGPIDQSLGRTASALKGAGKQWTDWRDMAGHQLTDWRDKGESGAADLGKGVQDFVTNPVGTAGKILGFGRGLSLDDELSPVETTRGFVRVGKVEGEAGGFELRGLDPEGALQNATHHLDQALQDAARRAHLTAQLGALLQALEHERIHERQHGRSGPVSELTVRFDRAMSHPVGTSDAVVTFAIQANSFQYTVDPRKGASKPVTASDVRVGQVTLKGFYGAGKPQVEIAIPRLRNASRWNVEELTRTTVLRAVEQYVPASRPPLQNPGGVAGHFDERLLAVHNATSETLHVWVQVESRHGAEAWRWLPAGPGEGYPAYLFTIAPGKSVALHAKAGAPALSGRRARLWAQTPSGRTWATYEHRDLALVKETQGASTYRSDTMEHFIFTFSLPAKAPVLHERIVAVRNDTKAAVLVHAEALTRDAHGNEAWHQSSHAVRLLPGQSAPLRQADGLFLRGSDARVWAADETGERYHWTAHQSAAVHQVAPEGYSGTSLGTFLYILEPPSAGSASVGVAAANELRMPADAVKPGQTHLVRVPDVERLTLEEARQRMAAAGLRFAAIVAGERISPERYATLSSEWHVVRQLPEPSAGATALRGATVLCTFERAAVKPTPVATTDVPPLRGLAAAEAATRLRSLHLRGTVELGGVESDLARVLERVSGLAVVEQSPAAGSRVRAGTAVRLVLARMTPAHIVPDVTGKHALDAKSDLEKHGLVVRHGNEPIGVVKAQKPAPGFTATHGDVVHLTFTGPPAQPSPVSTPRLVGLDLQAATSAAQQARLRLRVATTSEEATADRALINRTVVKTQSIPDGRQVEPGAEVEVAVVHFTAKSMAVNPPPSPPSVVGTWIGGANQHVAFGPNGVFRSGVGRPQGIEGRYALDGQRMTLEISGRTERGEARFEGANRLILNVGPFRNLALVRSREGE